MSLVRLAAAVWASLLLAFAVLPARAAPTFPPLTGRVVDDAHVLSPPVQADLTQKLADLETKTGRQLVVVTLPSLQGYEIEDYGYQLGRAWGIGYKGQNNGALFIIAPHERKVRIEVGYGLEPMLTDALSNVILQEQVLPKFRQGDIQGGIIAGADALIQQLSLDPTQAEERAAAAARAPPPESHGDPLSVIFTVIFVIFVLGALLRHRSGGLGMIAPLLLFGGGGWRGGDGGGGGFGGGFSGGGGSFGGGGASGSW